MFEQAEIPLWLDCRREEQAELKTWIDHLMMVLKASEEVNRLAVLRMTVD
jgi:hypothetical protein